MQIKVTTRHGELSESSQKKAAQKAERLHRYFDRLTAIEVVVDLKDENSPAVEIVASAEHRDKFVAHAQADSLWGSVDATVQKMEQQLRKHKEKLQSRHRNHDARHAELNDDESGETGTEADNE